LKKNILSIGITLLFVIALLSPKIFGNNIGIENEEKLHPSISSLISFDGNILYVGGSGPGNYTKIQDAIDNTSDGDTVFVYDDSSPYFENLVINVSINLIGENKHTTYINGGSNDSKTIYVKCSDVTISKFTLINLSHDGLGQVFYIVGTPYIENIYISDCILKDNDKGIFFTNIRNFSVSSCHFYNNDGQSIWGYKDSSNIIINNCIINNNGKDLGGGWFRNGGIQFASDGPGSFSNISIFDCEIFDNYLYGVLIEKETADVIIQNNNIYRNTHKGIKTLKIKNLEIFNNNIQGNKNYGIIVNNCDNTNISRNNVQKNGVYNDDYLNCNSGIGLSSISSLFLYNNTITNNFGWGVKGIYCDSANICNNKIDNNSYGILLRSSNNNSISDNNIMKSVYGIVLYADSNFNNISGNLISENINGTNIYYSGKNIISDNNILENENGIFIRDVKLPDTKILGNHKIELNNFINNNQDAFFRIEPRGFKNLFSILSEWNNNYWGRTRYIPKPIFGTVNTFVFHYFPWIQFDWHPAKEPYEIEDIK
jgi:parallel beta-helix repeat protein